MVIRDRRTQFLHKPLRTLETKHVNICARNSSLGTKCSQNPPRTLYPQTSTQWIGWRHQARRQNEHDYLIRFVVITWRTPEQFSVPTFALVMSVLLHFVVSTNGHKTCTFLSFRRLPLEYILCFHTINRFNLHLLILDTYLYINSCNEIFHHNLTFPLISHTAYYSYKETRYLYLRRI
jgi:hypothetical protein